MNKVNFVDWVDVVHVEFWQSYPFDEFDPHISTMMTYILQYCYWKSAHFVCGFSFAVCRALKGGMAGLFGPQSSVTSSHIQSICDTLEIPHIETRWDYRMKRDDYSVNLYPHPHAIGQVCQLTLKGQGMCTVWSWPDFVAFLIFNFGQNRSNKAN